MGEGLTRRQLLERLAAAVGAGLLAGCADTLGANLGRAALPAGTRKVASLASLTTTPAPISLGDATVFAFLDGGKPAVLSSACTHQGCTVAWDTGQNRFACPCHGGQFDRGGQVLAGPPPAPLTSYPTQTTNGVVYIRA
jgi:nitrite reductase/ring-hydroxylating ferredoxin subunit